MAKQLTFEFDGIPYTLEFTRSTVRRMEKNGFDIAKVEDAPMSGIYDLFAGALRAHHPNTDARKIDAMFDKMGDLTGWAEDLIEMYKEPFETLADDKQAGEIKRTKSW